MIRFQTQSTCPKRCNPKSVRHCKMHSTCPDRCWKQREADAHESARLCCMDYSTFLRSGPRSGNNFQMPHNLVNVKNKNLHCIDTRIEQLSVTNTEHTSKRTMRRPHTNDTTQQNITHCLRNAEHHVKLTHTNPSINLYVYSCLFCVPLQPNTTMKLLMIGYA